MTALLSDCASFSPACTSDTYAFPSLRSGSPRGQTAAECVEADRRGSDWAQAAGDSGPLTFNRRRLPRKIMKGGAMAIFTRSLCAGSVVRVELTDGSHTGLGLKSPVPVEPGTSFTLIPDQAMMPRAVGIAVRCERLEDGQYAVGLRTRQGAVAA